MLADQPPDPLRRPRSPYDTLEEVIGLRGTPGIGSLMDFGVTYRKLDLTPAGAIDWEALASAIRPGEGGGTGGRMGAGAGVGESLGGCADKERAGGRAQRAAASVQPAGFWSRSFLLARAFKAPRQGLAG